VEFGTLIRLMVPGQPGKRALFIIENLKRL